MPESDPENFCRLRAVTSGLPKHISGMDLGILFQGAEFPGKTKYRRPTLLAKVLKGDERPWGQENGIFHLLGQLPDIAGVFLLLEVGHGLGGETAQLFTVAQTGFAQKMIGKQRDIAFPFPQGGGDEDEWISDGT